MKVTWVLLAVLVGVALAENCDTLNLLPMPAQCNMSSEKAEVVLHDPCSLLFKLVSVPEQHRGHYTEVLNHFQKKTFGCAAANIMHVSASE